MLQVSIFFWIPCKNAQNTIIFFNALITFLLIYFYFLISFSNTNLLIYLVFVKVIHI